MKSFLAVFFTFQLIIGVRIAYAQETWYTYQSGDWNDPTVWTLDASTNPVYNNPSNLIPDTGDEVVITSTKRITMPKSMQNAQLSKSIEIEGILDMGQTDGSIDNEALTEAERFVFGKITGGGIIEFQGYKHEGNIFYENLPSPTKNDWGDFVGTIKVNASNSIYLNTEGWQSNNAFYDLSIDFTDAKYEFVLLENLGIANNLSIRSGVLRINKNNDKEEKLPNRSDKGKRLDISIGGNVSVSKNGVFKIGNALACTYSNSASPYHKQWHTVTVEGDFINDGVVFFSKIKNHKELYKQHDSSGVSLYFIGEHSNEFLINNQTYLYNLIIDKGAYDLSLNVTTDAEHFYILGNNKNGADSDEKGDSEIRKSIYIKEGTLILQGKAHVRSLSETDKGSFTLVEGAGLTLDGDEVRVDLSALGHGHSTYIQGVLEVKNGIFDTKGTVICFNQENGSLIVGEDGTDKGIVYTSQIRRSTQTNSQYVNLTQRGGTIYIEDGQYQQQMNGSFSLLHLEGENYSINLEAGTMIFESASAMGRELDNIITLDVNPLKSTATGKHQIIVRFNSGKETYPFYINSNTALGSLTIEETSDKGVFLNHDLELKGDLHIKNDVFDPGNYTVSLNGSLIIDDNMGANYIGDGAKHTIVFKGETVSTLTLNHLHDKKGHTFNNFIIDKPNGRLTLVGNSYKQNADSDANILIEVYGTFELLNGILDNSIYSARLYGDVFNYGTLGVYSGKTDALIRFREGGTTGYNTVVTNDNAHFGNIRLKNEGETLRFTSDIHVDRLDMRSGLLELGAYNLKLDILNVSSGGGKYPLSIDKMIVLGGNVSDGGLSLKVDKKVDIRDDKEGGDGKINQCLFPIGIAGKYTPVTLDLDHITASTNGYVTISIADAYLQTLNDIPTENPSDELLSYYWRVDYEDLTNGTQSIPTIGEMTMTADVSDIKNGVIPSNWVPGRVLDQNDGKLFDRQVIGNRGDISGKNITYVLNSNVFKGNYTAGIEEKFEGEVEVYYSRASNSNSYVAFNKSSNWSTKSYNNSENKGTYPQAGDVAFIGVDAKDKGVRYSTTDENIAVATLIFESKESEDPFNINLARLRITEGNVAEIGQVIGLGDVLFDIGNKQGVLNGDMGDFINQKKSLVSYALRKEEGFFTISDKKEFPSLRIYLDAKSDKPLANLTFSQDIKANNLLVDGNAIFKISNDVMISEDVKIGLNGKGTVFYLNENEPIALEIGGDLILDQASKLYVDEKTNQKQKHALRLGGDLILTDAGLFDLNNQGNASNVILELIGNTDAEFSINNKKTAIDLYRIKQAKAVGRVFTWNGKIDELTSPSDETSDAKPIVIESGKLILNNASIDEIISSGANHYFIPQGGELELQAGTLRTGESGNVFSSLNLDGVLTISGGNFIMDGENSGIAYTNTGGARINISAGNLLVGGYVGGASNDGAGILHFNQAGGNFVLGFKATDASKTDANLAVFNLYDGKFNLSGGTNTQFIIADVYQGDGALQIYEDVAVEHDGDTFITFGGVSTNFEGTEVDISMAKDHTTFKVNSEKKLGSFRLNNASVIGEKLSVLTTDLYLSNDLEIAQETTFELGEGRSLYIGGDLLNNGSFTSGIDAHTVFEGSVTQQVYGIGNKTQFYNLSHPSQSNLTIGQNVFVSNDVSHLDGNLITTGFTLELKGDLQMDAPQIHTFGVAGGIKFTSESSQSIHGTGQFARLHIANTPNASGERNGDVQIPNGNGSVTIDGTLILDKSILNINNNLLVLSEQTDVERIDKEADGTPVTAMISTNGSEIDKGVRKLFPANYKEDFVFPIGRDGAIPKYTPLAISFDGGKGSFQRVEPSQAGWITVKAEDAMLVAVINDKEDSKVIEEFDDTKNALQYYWFLDSDGLKVNTDHVKFTFDFITSDALHQDFDKIETSYISALLSKTAITWDKQYEGVVNDHQFSWRFVNGQGAETIAGYYTAGVGINDQGGAKEELYDQNGAIPDKLPVFITKKNSKDVDYTSLDTWDLDKSTGVIVEGVGPVGGLVIIDEGTSVNMNSSFRVLKTYIHETSKLRFQNGISGRLGAVSGAEGDAVSYLPNNIDQIPNALPGTFEFNITEEDGLIMPSYYWTNPIDPDDECDVNFVFKGSANYSIPMYTARSITIEVGETNKIALPNNVLNICEDFNINTGIATQSNAQNINVNRHFRIDNASELQLHSSSDFMVAGNFINSSSVPFNIPEDSDLFIGGDLNIDTNASLDAQTKTSSIYVQGKTTLDGELSMGVANTIELRGDVNVNTEGTISGESSLGSELLLGADFNNNGTVNLLNTYLVFNGSTLQTLRGVNVLENLRMNNTGEGLQLTSDLKINRELDLLDGILSTSVHKLVLANQTVLFGDGKGSKESYINGETEIMAITSKDLSQVDIMIPLGDGNHYRPLNLEKIAVEDKNWIFEYFSADPTTKIPLTPTGNLTSLALSGYYAIQTTSSAGAKVKLEWGDGYNWGVSDEVINSVGAGKSELKVAVAKDSDTNWTPYAVTHGSLQVEYGSISTSDHILENNTLTYVTMGIKGAEVLPVKLLYFNANRKNENTVELAWETASEYENQGFEIERSLDGINFESIGWVDGQGTSEVQVKYAFKDAHAWNGQLTYRLRQVNNSDMIEEDYYAIVNASISEVSIKVYPNPIQISNTLTLLYAGLSVNTFGVLEVRDLNGRLLKSKEVESDLNGNINETMTMDLQSGLYLVSLRISGKVYMKRVIVE